MAGKSGIDGIQCQCPRRLSLTIKSRAWSLDTGGDLLVWEPCRHKTADLSKAKLSAVRSHPVLCHRAGVASAQGVLLAACRRQWLPCPFRHLLQIPMVRKRLSQLHGHTVHRLGASPARGCGRWMSAGETSWLGRGWVKDPYVKNALSNRPPPPRSLLH